MSFNSSKFQALRLGIMEELQKDTMYFTPGYKEPIDSVDCVKDLGVTMDVDGDFSQQRFKVLAKTNQMAGCVQWTFYSRDINLMRTLWRSTVQPHCDYASQLWSPMLVASHIQQMAGLL